MKPYRLAILTSVIAHIVLLQQFDTTREVPEPRIVKLGVQLDYSELASRQQVQQPTPAKSALPRKDSQEKPSAKADKQKPAKAPEKTIEETEPKRVASLAKPASMNTPARQTKEAKAASKPVPDSDLEAQKADSAEKESQEIAQQEPVTNDSKVSTEMQTASNSKPETQTEQEVAAPQPSTPRFELGSIQNPVPGYPALARNRGWEGDVLIGVHVNADGSVNNLEILKTSHYGPLDHAAWVTVKNEWRFEPAEYEGEKVPAFVEVPISFRLTQASP